MAMKAANLECIEVLLEKGAKIFISDPIWNEMSPIFYAIRLNNVQILEMICDSVQAQ